MRYRCIRYNRMLSTPLHTEDDVPLPFPGRLGRGVRIAVIDSGVNAAHPHIGRVDGSVTITATGEIEPGVALDVLGHGTAVMAAIQEKAPEAEYFAIKLFDTALKAKTPNLLRAIEWAMDHQVDVINLSLGTRNLKYLDSFHAIAAKASAQGVTLVAARDADGQPCLPGCLIEVISVALDWDCHRNSYRVEESDGNPIFHASGYPRSLPGLPSTRNLHGISFAVANMTGLVARACEKLNLRSPETIKAELVREAASTAGAP